MYGKCDDHTSEPKKYGSVLLHIPYPGSFLELILHNHHAVNGILPVMGLRLDHLALYAFELPIRLHDLND